MAERRSRTRSSEPKADGHGSGRAGQPGGEFAYSPSERELIVVAEPSARLQATPTGLTSLAGADTSALASLLDQEDGSLEPLFGPSEEAIRARASAAGPGADTAIAGLANFYRVRAADDRLDTLASRLAASPAVAGAYVKPPSEPAAVDAPAVVDAPPATPDFTGRQGYLGPAPAGIDAQWAVTQPGGGGVGVRIVDVEGAWLFTHEDLAQNAGGVLAGTPTVDLSWRNQDRKSVV